MISSEVRLSLPDWAREFPEGTVACDSDDARMRLAIDLARRNVQARTGGPFGAAIFSDGGELVAIGVNRVVPLHCSLAHAEIMAFVNAQAALGRERLNADGQRYTLATSAQPCCQCYGASFWAGIDVMLIGARASDVMELTEFDEGPLPDDWVGELERRGISVSRDILREPARAVLREYSQSGGVRY